ncbi:GAS domain-containing protein [Klebsiella pneumoniae]|uniref:hypothetical protein n=1 Tax=Klebsiella pneumoniae TaxID=573 RepID=UPI000E2D913F|nr:Uncharacterised protein [Klebsiella pneumoniae]HBY5418647.1 hypothetical protein [Klebsiella pneumoniae]
MTDTTELTPEAARELGSILIIVAARMARREFFTPLHALCESGQRVVSTRALRDAVGRAEEHMVSQVSKIVDGHDRLTKKLKEAESRNAELVEALEKAQQRIDELENDEVRQRLANAEHQLYMAELAKHNLKASRNAQFRKRRAAEKRIGELEREQEQLRPVGVMSEQAFHRLENRECRFIALWPRPGIFLQRKRPEDGVIVYARTATAAGIKVEAE